MRAKAVWYGVGFVGLFAFMEWNYSVSDLFSLDMIGPNPFASDLFREILPVGDVVVSESGGSAGSVGPQCWIAIARLREEAPFEPPEIPLADRNPLGFGGNWRKAPERLQVSSASDPLDRCGHLIPPEIMTHLQLALARPTAFYIRNWRDKVMQVYSHDDLIVAYIQFGVRR